MKRTALILAAALVLCAADRTWADAAGDLSAGRAALAGGDAAKAIGLLESAVQALPQSVEAQLELARAYLGAGQLDKALTQFRAVLRLSPDHAEATRLVEALTGQARTFDQKLAAARALMDAGLHALAVEPLRELVRGPYDPAQRLSARLALAEALLWQQFGGNSLADAALAIQDAKGTPSEPVARVIAALMLISSAEREHKASAADLLKDVGDLPAPWKQRAELAQLVLRLDEKTAAEVSAKLAGPLSACPDCAYRHSLVVRLAQDMGQFIGQADMKTALAIAWPMLTKDAPPAGDPVEGMGKADFGSGWLAGSVRRTDLSIVVSPVKAIGQNEFLARPREAPLVGYVLAGEFLRRLPEDLDGKPGLDLWLGLIEEMGSLSRPAPDRKKGEPLSQADEIQLTWMRQLAGRLSDEAQRARLVQAVLGQVTRYEAAGDLETGLKRFVVEVVGGGPAAAPAPKPALVQEIGLAVGVGPGPALTQELVFLADKQAALGQQFFVKAVAAQVRKPDIFLENRADQIAVVLYRKASILRPQDPKSAEVNRIVDRYAGADQWGGAEQVLALFSEGVKGDAGRWDAARLKIRQAQADQDKALAAQHRLPETLDPLTAAALKTVVDILKDDPGDANKSMAAGLAGGLTTRYLQLDRSDLAEAVIAALTPQGLDALADWALLERAKLLDVQAAAATALAARQFDGAKALALNAKHDAELKLLGELLDRFGDSPYVPSAVDQVAQIADTYRGLRAFDAAAQLLDDFVKPRPAIQAAQRLAWQRIDCLLAKASDAFAQRRRRTSPPQN